jgi:hypothetical protein
VDRGGGVVGAATYYHGDHGVRPGKLYDSFDAAEVAARRYVNRTGERRPVFLVVPRPREPFMNRGPERQDFIHLGTVLPPDWAGRLWTDLTNEGAKLI